MLENENMQVNTEPTETAEGGVEEETTTTNENIEETSTTEEKNDGKDAPTSFTQEQVNDMVRERLNRVYKGYGVENQEQLNELVEKSRGYDELKTKFDELSKERKELVEKVAFMENDINPDRYEDIRAYFKGKELDFSNANLQSELATHNEWRNVKQVEQNPTTTITSLGSSQTDGNKGLDEREVAQKLFGIKFVK